MFIGKSPEERALAGEEIGVSLTSLFKKIGDASKTPLGKTLMPKVAIATAAIEAIKKAGIPLPKGPIQRREIVTPTPRPHIPQKQAIAGYFVGAEPPMSAEEVMDLIRREPNQRKRERMLMNFERARTRSR